jgi:DNA processing protein
MLAKSLVSYFGGAEEVFNASRAKWMKVPGIGEKTVGLMDLGAALGRAEEELKFIEKNNIVE